jgi:NADPH-dependent 2,4-dienoyl-CoA reductase/sulfur reductase-like enzyme
MQPTRYLLMGGGLASYSAAKAIREIDKESSLTIIGQEPVAPYDRPPLTKEFMRGKKPLAQVFLDSPDFYRENGITLVTGVAVTAIDASPKLAHLSDGGRINFDKALIATGGRPLKLDIPGADFANVHYFRTLSDAAAVAGQGVAGARAVVIGGGFIGMELASSLTQRGAKVCVVQSAPRIWSRFVDEGLSAFFQDYVAGRGVEFHTGQKPAAILGDKLATSVKLQSGAQLPCDFVCIAVGIEPNIELARQIGLQIDNGIIVDERLCTSHPDIYAAGDVANFPDPFFNKRRRVEHWSNAQYGGDLAGRNMCRSDNARQDRATSPGKPVGQCPTYEPSAANGQANYELLTYVWSDIFDLHLEFAGDESERDRSIIRGRPAQGPFSVLYMKGDRMTAYFAINLKKKEYSKLGKLIESRADLAGKDRELADPNFDVESLLAVAAK